MTEIADVVQEAAEAEARLRDARLTERATTEAIRRGLGDRADAVAALVDRNLIVYDDNHEPRNVLEAVDNLIAAKPWLTESPAQHTHRDKPNLRAGRLARFTARLERGDFGQGRRR